MAHLSIHGCTCCVPASVVSKVADKQRAVECRELGASSASSAFRYNAYRPCAPRMAHLSIHGCTCCVPASVVSKVADKQRTAKSRKPAAQMTDIKKPALGGFFIKDRLVFLIHLFFN